MRKERMLAVIEMGIKKMVVYEQEDELHKEFLKRVTRIISKKLYVIGSSILEEINYIED